MLLFDLFVHEYTEPEGQISYKTVYFLWKIFLFKKSLPYVLSQTNFKQMLQMNNIYNADTDSCNVKPKFSLSVLNFEMFWTQQMVLQGDAAYTVEEMVSVYHEWCDPKHLELTVDLCREWVTAYHPDHIVGNIVHGFKCKVWDKNIDIENALEAHTVEDIDLYEFYCNYTQIHSKRTVSKEYFDGYVGNR
jgi:hypothetical protein